MAQIFLPLLETGNKKYDKAFTLACGDLIGNIIPYCAGILKDKAPVFCAGAGYRTPWTRDAAFNTWYAGALISPQTARNTLLSVLAEKTGKYTLTRN